MKINNGLKQLYHGTDCYFESFDFRYAKSFKDFGKGFYLTSDLIRLKNGRSPRQGEKIRLIYIVMK